MRPLALLTACLLLADGTAQAQALLRDIYPGPDGISGEPFEDPTVFDGVVYFRASDGTHGREYWRTDGTPEGTWLLKDTLPGSETGARYTPRRAVVNGHLLLVADDGVHGTELWRTDGTEAGTVMVKDIWPGDGSSRPSDMAVLDGVAYFGANDGTHGEELWRSDGTAEGTYLVADLTPGSEGSPVDPEPAIALDGVLYLGINAGDQGEELWRTDGTAEGTSLVKEINPTVSTAGFGLGASPGEMVPFGGGFLFAADDGVHGRELWRSDGTAEGTVLIKDINPSTTNDMPDGSFPFDLVPYGEWVYFSVGGQTIDGAIWRTNGTADGTELVLDADPSDSWFPRPRPLIVYEGHLYLSAPTDPPAQGDIGGRGGELWRTDGLTTTLVADLNPGPQGSTPRNAVIAGGLMHFAAFDDDHGIELWRSDGTEAGTVRLTDITPGPEHGVRSNDTPLVVLGDRLIFVGIDPEHGAEMWALDLLATSAETGPAGPGLALTAWPNPAADRLTVAVVGAGPRESVRVEVVDALGRVVSRAGGARVEVDTSALAPGVYVVRAVAPTGTASQTLTVVR